MRTWLTMALMGCGAPAGLLGGQEGEPLAPPAQVPLANDGAFADPNNPAPEPPPDNDNDGLPDCAPEAHCNGEGWCAEYGPDSVPDLEVTCKDNWEAGPCDSRAVVETCPLGLDPCSAVVVYDASMVCEDLAAGE